MTTDNILRAVATLQDAELAFLSNTNVFMKESSKKFDNFQDFVGNLGRSVTYTKPYRAYAVDGLVASDQPIEQRYGTLTVNQSANVSMPMTSEEILFNVERYMDEIGMGQVMELGAKVEANLAKNAASAVVSQIDGVTDTDSGPYRFYGNGVTAINSYQQLRQAVANFMAFGSPKDQLKFVLPLDAEPAIIGTGLNQFAPERNNDIANSWELGRWGSVDYYTSNLLNTHFAGNVGVNATTLTVVSINAAGTEMVLSGAGASDSDAIKAGDLGQFTAASNLYFRTFVGHELTRLPVQFRVTADAGSTGGGQVTVSITPALVSAPGRNQNISQAVTAGMTITFLPSHVAGLLYYKPAFFVSTPKLPPEKPFDSVSKIDPETGIALRTSYGATLGANTTRLIHYCAWGSELDKDYCMRIIFPVTNN